MHLKELTINGFKSFAKKSELEFSTPITAIVGPNGSGKSNVAEAFRFVLGEQSIKSMRGKKGEDLIWGGTESVSRANRASVIVKLDNASRVFPLDFDEIVAERTVHRDGSNEYSINGSRVRLKDVQELLAAANIGSTGHHIISQGEADRVLTASPKERREMIEDALGLKVYQYKKQEAERKLVKTTENIAQVESLRREVAPHLKFLERQVKKIERSLKLQEELKSFYQEYLRREDAYIAFHQDRLKTARKQPEAEREALQTELVDAKAKLESEQNDEKRDALVALEEQIGILRNERQRQVRQGGQLEGQIEYLTKRIADIQRRAEEVQEPPIPYQSVKVVAENFKIAYEKVAEGDLDDMRSVVEAGIKDLDILLTKTASHAAADTDKEEADLKQLQKDKLDVDAKLEKTTVEEEKVQTEYESLQQSIEAEQSESRAAEREIFRIMNRQRELDTELNRIEMEERTIERDREEFKRELQEGASLIGSSAARYFDFTVTDGDRELTQEDFVAEERSAQLERRRELEKMKIRLEELGAGSNEDVLKEYKDVKERDEFLESELGDLTASVEKLETLIANLTTELNEQFIEGIEKIDSEFSKFFTLMFGGGEAQLVRVKPKPRKKKDEDIEIDEDEAEEEVEEGIEIDVKLPNKRVRGLEMLSGGERALTSIAVIFAMSQVNPPLFVILDETDAALDEANSRRYGDMIEALAKRSQLILITHNRETMSRAGVLYGVTMGSDGVSKLLSVKFDEAVAVAK